MTITLTYFLLTHLIGFPFSIFCNFMWSISQIENQSRNTYLTSFQSAFELFRSSLRHCVLIGCAVFIIIHKILGVFSYRKSDIWGGIVINTVSIVGLEKAFNIPWIRKTSAISFHGTNIWSFHLPFRFFSD